ncbi:MAG: sigma-54 dependent transcriptional regulator [Nitrospiraceae bacterium]|nr:sigma-54 dependent transcriptional regulator [Nitrospiraceae bacterium]
MKQILIIDDDDYIRDSLNIFFKEKGFATREVSNCQAGLDLLKEENFDLIIVDLVMPGMGGLEFLRKSAGLNLDTPAIVVTAFGTVQTAVEAMKFGAFDYITKPFVLDELMIIVERAIGVSMLQKENFMLKKQLKSKYKFNGLIGDSPGMQRVYEMIEKIADIDSTVIITGESGTGKEQVAKTIHYNSSRLEQPFVPINCAAIPKDLMESELFGHEKGAFTGALNTRLGRFELASNGTLFLDEIGELDLSLQVKLLRVIQEKEFERVGGSKTIKVDVRILAATNKDLEQSISEGKFREDLFYRLNVIPLHIPPLRERKDDIPLLIDHFVGKFAKKRKRDPLRFTSGAMECLLNYGWPGNVRELENLIERLAILVSGNSVAVSDLPEKFQGLRVKEEPAGYDVLARPAVRISEEVDSCIPDEGINLVGTVEGLERKLIINALSRTNGVKSKAAKLLGLNRTTLIEKMKKMNIETPSAGA